MEERLGEMRKGREDEKGAIVSSSPQGIKLNPIFLRMRQKLLQYAISRKHL